MVMNVILHWPAKAFKVNYACIFWSSLETECTIPNPQIIRTHKRVLDPGWRKRTNKLFASWEPEEETALLPTKCKKKMEWKGEV
jgi:hypothetical protein